MKKIFSISLLSILIITDLMAQESQPEVLFYYVHTKKGEVYRASSYTIEDDIYRLNETNLGETVLKKSEVAKIVNVEKGASIKITNLDNTSYSGNLEAWQGDLISVSKSDGTIITINSNYINSVEISNTSKSSSESGNPNSTRYLFAPSAIPLEKGSGYYQNAYIASNSANYGLTSNVSVGGGVVLPVLFYITPKVSLKLKENLYTGAGFIYTTTFLPNTRFGAAIPYGLFTYGNHNNNITVGSGYGLLWEDGERTHSNSPIVTINGMYKLTNKLHFISENWFIPYVRKEYEFNPITSNYDETEVNEYALILSGGTRIKVTDNSTIDFAAVIITIPQKQDIWGVPFLGYVYKF